MNDLVFEIMKVIVMVAMLVISRYLIPWLRDKIGIAKLETAEKWANYAVLAAQQVLSDEKGADRKAYVTQFLKEILTAKNIALSDEQLDALIEAAVYTMKKS